MLKPRALPFVCLPWEVRALKERRLVLLRRPAVPGVTPFGDVGTALRVQERFCWPEWENARDLVSYAADYADLGAALRHLATFREGPTRWTRATAMPVWASRIFLVVTALEMVQVQMAVDTAPLEGVVREGDGFGLPGAAPYPSAAAALEARWDADHGEGAWARNGWTWMATVAISKLHVSAEDEMRARGREAVAAGV